MKQIILLSIVFFSTRDCFAQLSIPDNWKLSSKQATTMMRYYSDCTGDCFTSKARPDTTKENLIRAMFPNAKSFSWEDARYRNEDVARYASRNIQAAKTGGGQVGGYTTRILKVVDADDSVHYFDVALICPPPSICDSLEE